MPMSGRFESPSRVGPARWLCRIARRLRALVRYQVHWTWTDVKGPERLAESHGGAGDRAESDLAEQAGLRWETDVVMVADHGSGIL